MKKHSYEIFVDFETAVKLKHLKFNWLINSFYMDEFEQEFYVHSINADWNGKQIFDKNTFSAPSLDIVNRWLIEVKGYYVCVYDTQDNKWSYSINKVGSIGQDNPGKYFNSYEDALDDGIKYFLENYHINTGNSINLNNYEIGTSFKTNYDETCFLIEKIYLSTDWPYKLMFTDGTIHHYNEIGQTLSAQGPLKEVVDNNNISSMKKYLIECGINSEQLNKFSLKNIVKTYIKRKYNKPDK